MNLERTQFGPQQSLSFKISVPKGSPTPGDISIWCQILLIQAKTYFIVYHHKLNARGYNIHLFKGLREIEIFEAGVKETKEK